MSSFRVQAGNNSTNAGYTAFVLLCLCVLSPLAADLPDDYLSFLGYLKWTQSTSSPPNFSFIYFFLFGFDLTADAISLVFTAI